MTGSGSMVGSEKKKSKVPPPKYMCLPKLLRKPKGAFALHGSCKPINELKNRKDVIEKYSQIENEQKVEHVSQMRHIVLKNVRNKWLEERTNSQFWSHVIFGINGILRKLEANRSNTSQQLNLKCVFVDADWLTTQLGHHLINLCAFLSVRLVGVKPNGSLRELVTTSFKPLKKLIAFGICASVDLPTNLASVLELIELQIPVLQNAKINTLGDKNEIKEKRGSSFKRPQKTNKESWDEVTIDSSIYHYSPSNNTVCSLLEYCQLKQAQHCKTPCSPMKTEDAAIREPTEHAFLPFSDDMSSYYSPDFQQIEAQTPEDRKTKKMKRKKEKFIT